MALLPNPEAGWAPSTPIQSIDRRDVERRLGPTDADLEVLPGGRANTNVRVGPDRVLRVYRRDPRVARKEQTLLQQPWESFVVPAVVRSGDDFLVLDYVAHRPLIASGLTGAQLGRASAEIHRRRFSTAGFLDADLDVAAPFDDVVDAFIAYARSELDRTMLPPGCDLRVRVEAFLMTHRATLRHAAGPPVLLHGDFKPSNLHAAEGERLLVLDWEFAYAGPALMDIGQLLRWRLPPAVVDAFAWSYREHGGELPEDWQRLAEEFDLFNLVGLLGGAAPGSPQAVDVQQRIEDTLASHGVPPT